MQCRPGVLGRTVLLFGLWHCGDPPQPDDRTTIEGALVEVGTRQPVVGEVTAVPDLGTVRTSSPGGTFRLDEARFGVRYRLTAEAQGYLQSVANIVPRFGEPSVIDLEMQPAVACAPGQRRCAQGGGQEAVETCRSDGRGFTAPAPCSPGEVCSAEATCVGAPMVTVEVLNVESGRPPGGSVVSAPAGIACPPTCERAFAIGTVVTLEASAAGDAAFDGWQGDCSGSERRCQLRLDMPRRAEAVFRTTKFRLTALTTNGPGSVSSVPAGIQGACPQSRPCEALFDRDTSVTLTASAGASRRFRRWQEDCSGTSLSCVVRMDRPRRVRAQFQPPMGPMLDVRAVGPGAVDSSPSGIDGCAQTSCSAAFDQNQEVELRATPAEGARFSGWDGACSSAGSNPVCTVRMEGDRSVTARFEADTVEIRIVKAGGAAGTVTSSTALGIDCGSTCSALFPRGQAVELVAAGLDSGRFVDWSGGGCSGSAVRCTLTPTGDVTVTARFEPFWLLSLPKDEECEFGLDFDPPDRFTDRCGSGRSASAPGWGSVDGRTAELGRAAEAPPSGSPMDLMRSGPSGPPATVELTVRRSGGSATLFMDTDRLSGRRAGVSLRVRDDGALVASTFDGLGGATTATSAPDVLPVNTWAHVAMVLEPDALALFLDGELLVRAPGPLRLAGSSSTAWVGAARTGTTTADALAGDVDALRISSSARY